METESNKLNYEGYEIIKMSLEKNSNISDKEKEIGFLFKVVPEKEIGFEKVNIIEGVIIEPTETFKYKLEVIIKGNFKIENCKDEKEKKKYLLLNASAILFPYLRAQISLLSSQTDYENIILPVINFHQVIKGIPENELYLDSSQFREF